LTSYSINKILYKIKRDGIFRKQFLENFQEAIRGFPLSEEEKKALELRDCAKLLDLGAKAMLLLPFAGITRTKRSFSAG
jgi:hypothetical protein